MAKVSVIIPVLNGAKYIRECMESIVRQTLTDLQIIPVDAGSTDGTLEILEEYAAKDARIKLMHSDKKSTGYQSNIGMETAEGEYIGFCESDDYISKTMYERLCDIADKNSLDYVKSDFDMFIDKEDERIFLNYHILAGNRTALYATVMRPSDHPDILYRDVNMWNGIYKRKFIKKNKIKQNETPGAAFQDIGFVMQTFLAAEKAMYVHEDANKYRKDNVGSSVYNLKSIVNVVQEAEYSKEYLPRLRIEDNIKAVIFQRFCSLFFGFYGQLPAKEQFTEEVEAAVERFGKLAAEAYIAIPYYASSFEGIGNSLSLHYLLSDLDKFDILRKQIKEIDRNCFHSFYNHIEKYARAVIFGAGEAGTSLYALLRKNDYERVECFTDNDQGKWGRKVMGKEIIAPDRLESFNDGKTVFIIAILSHIEVIREQLLNMGVSPKNICKGIIIIPHNAMEVDIRNQEPGGNQ